MHLLIAVVKLLLGIVQGLLWVRFVLKILGAGETARIVAWVYDITGAMIAPFANIFPNWVFLGRFTVEFTTLFVILLVAIVEFIIVRVLRSFKD